MKRILGFLIFAGLLGAVTMVCVHNYLPKTVKRSVIVPDQASESADAKKVCGTLLPKVTEITKNHTCILQTARRATAETDVEHNCVDGPGVAGCFACVFECRWDLPEPLKQFSNF